MRRFLVLVAFSLAACATSPAPSPAEVVEGGPPQQPPVHGVTPGHKCDATGTETLIGRTRSDSIESAIKRATKAAVLRWSPPGTMLTMDYREDRVTVWIDPAKKITKIRCG